MKKLKQYFKMTLLIVLVSLFNFNCEKEDDFKPIEVKTENSGFNVSKISNQEVFSNNNIKEKLERFSLKSSDHNRQNKEVISSEYNFTIDTEEVIYIENNDNGYHSYTFPVKRITETDALENLVLSFQEDGTYKAILARYDLTHQDKLNLINRVSFDLTDKTTFYLLDDNQLIDDIFSKEFAEGDCVGVLMCPYGQPHRATQVCIDQERGDLYLNNSMCSDIDSGGGGSSSGGSSSGGSSSGGSSGGSTAGTGTTSNGGSYQNNTGSSENQEATVITIPIKDQIELCLGLSTGANGYTSEMATWLDELQNKDLIGGINTFLENGNCSEESREFVLYAITILMSDPDANPLLGADCRSFEYAQPPGALQKGCGVTDFDHKFYSGEIEPDGSFAIGYIQSHFDIVYFTMPPWMTNGQAANLTATAVTSAITATDLYFFENPDSSIESIGNYFINQIQSFMGIVGGQMVSNAPFNIPSPAPYLTSLGGAAIDCN